jgi:cobalt/nickel transport system permease protein
VPTPLPTAAPRRAGARRLPAGPALVAAVATVVGVVALPRGAWLAWGALGAALVVAGAALRVAPRRVLGRLLLAEPFVLGIAALSLLQRDGGVVFASMLAKSTLCLLTMILLAETTRFTELLGVARRLRVPAVLVTTLALLYRYLFVLREEASRLRRARRSRTFTPRRGVAWSGAASDAAHLFVRTTVRAERVYAAMLARGGR